LTVLDILSSRESIAIYVAAAGVAVSVITYWYQRKEFRIKSLTEAIRRLDDMKHREARKVLYGNHTSASFEIPGLRASSEEQLKNLSKHIVRSDLNEVATLIHHKLLDKKIFVREYTWIIVKTWRLLEVEIQERRKTIGPRDYMNNFEELKEAVLKVYPEYSNI
jgi:hypothetical protein